MRMLILLFVSYVAAAPLTTHISMDLTATDWNNLWTYFFWLFSFVIWFLIAMFGLAVSAALIAMFGR